MMRLIKALWGGFYAFLACAGIVAYLFWAVLLLSPLVFDPSWLWTWPIGAAIFGAPFALGGIVRNWLANAPKEE